MARSQPNLGTDAELATVQQDDGITLARFEVAGGQTVDIDGLTYEVHGHTILMFSELENIIL